MILNAVILLLAAFANFALSGFVYRQDTRNSINQSFGVFTINVALWTVAVFMGVIARSESIAFLWVRLSFVLAVFMPATFYLFASVFPEGKPIKLKGILFLFSSAFLTVILFSPYHLKSVILTPYIPKTEYGPAFPLFTAYFLAVMIYAFAKLKRKWKIHSGIKRLQIQYVFLGGFLALILASFSNLLAPLLGINQFEGYGPIFSLLMTGFIFYAIVKYQLMDIIVAVRKTTFYILLTISITIGYIGIVLLSSRLFGGIMVLETLIPAMIAALLIAFAFIPLREQIQSFIDKSVFRQRYDHHQIMNDLSRFFTSIISLDDLLKTTLKMITGSMGIESGIVYMRKNDSSYYPATGFPQDPSPENTPLLSQGDPLILAFERERQGIVREQFDRLPNTSFLRDAAFRLETLQYEIGVPIFLKGRLIAVLMASRKMTGDAYTREDIEMFSTLSYQLAVAIENAQLYTQVQESKIYQEILLENLVSGVIAMDTNSSITVFNRKAEEILEIPSARVLGRKSKVLPPDLHEALQTTWREKQKSFSRELVLKLLSGKEIPLSLNLSVFRSPDGDYLGVLALLTDLTEKKILEGEIRRTDRLALLGTLAAGMAHEIKNPLVSLKTYFQLLPEKYSEKEFRTDFASLAVQEVERINRLVEQLLNYARPSSPLLGPTDLKEVLESTLLLIKNRLSEQNIVLEKDFPERPLVVQGSGEQLKQVFLNMFINSLQAMGREGILKIKVRLVTLSGSAQDYLERSGLKGLKSGDWAIVEISDSGAGIDQKDILRLFDPFFSTKEKGAGLGLAVVDSIVSEHGGKISVRSRLGAGSTFYVSLPMASQAEART